MKTDNMRRLLFNAEVGHRRVRNVLQKKLFDEFAVVHSLLVFPIWTAQ
jgi:hypothetical protein